MERMIAGYRRFRSEVFEGLRGHFKSLSESQAPHTLFITCADSRIVPSLITQTEPGELFICRVVGNLVPAFGADEGAVSSAIEYSVGVLGVRHVVVCGHSDCGAMRAFLHPEKLASLKSVSFWLTNAQTAITVARQEHGDLPPAEFVDRLIEENVVTQLSHLQTHPSVAAALRKGVLQIHGWVYNIGNGEIKAYDEEQRAFHELGAGVLAGGGA